MEHRLVELLEKGRRAYAFPHARVVTTRPTRGQLTIPVSRNVKWACVTRNHATDLALDEYHGRLLRSKTPLQNVLGCASTVFWGYVTRNESFGRYKAWRLVAGNEKQMIHTQLKQVVAKCAAGGWGGALEELSGVRELGRVSFASKVVAFVDPKNAGVYDKRVNDFLFETGLKYVFFSPKIASLITGAAIRYPQVSEPAIRHVYQQWCCRLQEIRDGLNHVRVVSRWRCGKDTNQVWRAVDVERAIFAFTKVPRGSSSRGGTSGAKLNQQEKYDLIRLLKRFLS
jgi:hypothetical protein